jgi:outer membrane receptor for ferrienterochelin and colicin
MIKQFMLICCALMAFCLGRAQETTSEILGIVTGGGAPLQGASVKAVHTPSGTVYSTTSRKDGRYNLNNTKVGGPYIVTVSFVGFNSESRDNIILSLGEGFAADFALKPAASSLTEVVVSASRQEKVFSRNRTGSQEIVNRQQIERLPTINRSLQDFTKLTPSSNGLSFGGRSGAYNNITVDGANFNNAFGLSGTLGGQTNSQPISLDAIEQIQVNLSPYDVRQGGFSGAGVNSVTRSGTNTFKATVYTYLRGPQTQGYRLRTNKLPQPEFTYNLRGLAVGGAIKKNKLFFFVSGEQERADQPATTLTASRSGSSAIPGVVSQANADSLNQLKSFLQSKFGYNPGEFEGYNFRTQSDKLTVRIDWNINSKNTFTLKYNYLKSLRDIAASNSGAPGNNRQPSDFGLPFSGAGYTINNNFNIFIGELNTKFSNRANNKLQVGYTQLRDFRAPIAAGDFPLVDIISTTPNGSSYTAFGYEPFTYNNKLSTDVFQISDFFTTYVGSHEITLGTQNFVKRFENGFAPQYAGAFTFRSFADFYNSVNNGVANASRYQLRYSLLKDGSFPFAKINATELGFFAQDKWKIKNNFTLSLGVRIDLPIFDNTFDRNTVVDTLKFRNGKQYSTANGPGTNPLFSPRLGFNWDVFNDKRTQVRGGVGLFAGPPPFVWISNQASNNGVQFGSFDLIAGTGSSQTPQNDPRFVFNPNINAYRPAAGAPPTAYDLVFTDPDFKYPQVLKASVAVDQKLPGDLVITAEFIYNKDVHAVNFENVNLPTTGAQFNGLDKRVRYSSPRIYSGTTVGNPRINSAILMKNYNEGYGYVATLQVQKTMRNFYTSVAYTYSKSRSLNDGGSIAASMWRDRPVQADPNAAELGFSNFYQPHRFIGSGTWRKEYGKHFATSIGAVLEIAPTSTASYLYQNDPNNDGAGGNNDLIYIPRTSAEIVLVPVNTGGGTITDTRTPAQIWNQLDAFINQDPYLSKNRGKVAERNGAISPYFKKLDLNITQDIYFNTKKDRHTLRLSLDIINASNLMNRRWGIVRGFTNTAPLRYEGLVPASDPVNVGRPRYSFPYQNAAALTPLVNSYQDFTGLTSRWQMQFGIRYLFN